MTVTASPIEGFSIETSVPSVEGLSTETPVAWTDHFVQSTVSFMSLDWLEPWIKYDPSAFAIADFASSLSHRTSAPLTRPQAVRKFGNWLLEPWLPARKFAISARSIIPRAEIVRPASTANQIMMLHESSGLTWDQIARLFNVSRRTVHNWAGGARLNAANIELLARVSAILSAAPTEAPAEVRAWLLASREGRRSIFDELRAAGQRRNPLEDVLSLRERLGLA